MCDDGADGDGDVHVAVEADVADCAAVDASPFGFELVPAAPQLSGTPSHNAPCSLLARAAQTRATHS